MFSYEIASSCLCWVFVTIVLVQMVPQTTAILGGEDARIGDFPFIASVGTLNKNTCTGVILSKYYILTAAHCVIESVPETKYKPIVIRKDLIVIVGTTSREYGKFVSKSLRRGFADPIKKVKAVTIYDRYRPPAYQYYDFALLRLAERLEFSENVQSIPLSTTQLPENSDVTVAGWGRKVLRTGGQEYTMPQDKLQRTVIKARKCPQEYREDLTICLESTDSHRTTIGDSGGPVIYEDKLVGILVGVKAEVNFFASFALKILERNVLEWIKRNVHL